MTERDSAATAPVRCFPRRSDILGCCVLTLGVWALTQGVFIASPYIANNDVCQQIYWMQRFRDAGLYPPDIMNDYARSYVSWGVRGLYYAASSWIDAIRFSKILPAFSYLSSGLLLFLLGGRLGGRAAAWASVAVLWLYPLPLHTMTGGLARTFALPLTLLFLAACAWRARKLMHLALLLQALFIPYIFPACALTVLLPHTRHFALRKAGSRREAPAIFALHWSDLAVMGAAVLCIVAWQQQMAALGFGPLPTAAQLAADPIYSDAGRFPVWPLFLRLGDLFFMPAYELLGMRGWSSTGHALGVALFYLCFLLCLRRAGRQADEFALYLWYGLACLCMYALAHALALRLFIPGRQLEYMVDIAVCLLFGLGLGLGWHALSARFSRHARVGAVLLVCLAALAGSARLHQRGLTDYSEYAPLYLKARSLPPNALLAGHPMLMDAVHTFGLRNVLASRKLAHPWSLGYWARYEPRLRASLDALYAKDPKTLVALREQYGVSHLIALDCQFADWFIQGTPLFAPYNAYIRELAARPGVFLLERDGPLPGVEIQPGVRIISLADIPADLPAPTPRPARARPDAAMRCGPELFWRLP